MFKKRKKNFAFQQRAKVEENRKSKTLHIKWKVRIMCQSKQRNSPMMQYHRTKNYEMDYVYFFSPMNSCIYIKF